MCDMYSTSMNSSYRMLVSVLRSCGLDKLEVASLAISSCEKVTLETRLCVSLTKRAISLARFNGSSMVSKSWGGATISEAPSVEATAATLCAGAYPTRWMIWTMTPEARCIWNSKDSKSPTVTICKLRTSFRGRIKGANALMEIRTVQ